MDTFAEARQRDVLNLAEELEYNLANDVKLTSGWQGLKEMDPYSSLFFIPNSQVVSMFIYIPSFGGFPKLGVPFWGSQ